MNILDQNQTLHCNIRVNCTWLETCNDRKIIGCQTTCMHPIVNHISRSNFSLHSQIYQHLIPLFVMKKVFKIPRFLGASFLKGKEFMYEMNTKLINKFNL